MDIIIAADKEWNIGKEGKLLANLPTDLKRFKKITEGHVIIMGRKTFDSLPNGPLPNRINVVITSRGDDLPEGVFNYNSVEALLEDLNQFILNNFATGWFPNFYVIGGGNLIEQMLPYCTQALVTKMNTVFEDADVKMPNLDELADWHPVLQATPIEEDGVEYQYYLYKKQ